MRIIMSHDEAQTIGQHIKNMRPYTFKLRIVDKGKLKKQELEFVFKEYSTKKDI